MTDEQLRQIIATSCALRGCTCRPEVTVHTDCDGLLVHASIAHDLDCPASTDPEWN